MAFFDLMSKTIVSGTLFLLFVCSNAAFSQRKIKPLPSDPEQVDIVFYYNNLQVDSSSYPSLTRNFVLTDAARALYEQRFVRNFNDYSVLMKVGNYPVSEHQLSMHIIILEPGYNQNRHRKYAGLQGYAVLEQRIPKDTLWTFTIPMRRGIDVGADNDDVDSRLRSAYGIAARYLVLRSGINKSKEVDRRALSGLYAQNEKKEISEMYVPKRRSYRRTAILCTVGGGSVTAAGLVYALGAAIMGMDVGTAPNYDQEKAAKTRSRDRRISGSMIVAGLPVLVTGLIYFKKSNQRVYMAFKPLVIEQGNDLALVPQASVRMNF